MTSRPMVYSNPRKPQRLYENVVRTSITNQQLCLEAVVNCSKKPNLESSRVLTRTGRSHIVGMTEASGKWRLHSDADCNNIVALIGWMLQENLRQIHSLENRFTLSGDLDWYCYYVMLFRSRAIGMTRRHLENDVTFWIQRPCSTSSWKLHEFFANISTKSNALHSII